MHMDKGAKNLNQALMPLNLELTSHNPSSAHKPEGEVLVGSLVVIRRIPFNAWVPSVPPTRVYEWIDRGLISELSLVRGR
jgi:hypothetical protein